MASSADAAAALEKKVAQAYRDIYDTILLGMVTSLSKRPGVVDVKVMEQPGADQLQIREWQRKYGVALPADLAQFMSTNDGLTMVWSIQHHGKVVPLGEIHVHSLNEMRTVDSSTGGFDEDSFGSYGGDENVSPPVAVDGHRCDVVEIDRCGGSGHVGLVYRDKQKPEVWFADRSGTYHYIASSFTEYLKLMASHLGIPGWQYAFTPLGLAPSSQQWFNLFAPIRLGVAQHRQDTVLLQQSRYAHQPTDIETRRQTKMDLGKILRAVHDATHKSSHVATASTGGDSKATVASEAAVASEQKAPVPAATAGNKPQTARHVPARTTKS